MPVTSVAVDDLFVYRVIKSHENNPSDQWANSYEFKALSSGSEAELLTLGIVLVNFEKAIHKNVVVFDRLIISTWEEDSTPYDPTSFISSSLSGVGAVGEVGGTAAVNTCLNVTRVAAYGRFGHLFYRGVLDLSEIESPAGKSTLVDRAGIQANIDAALVSSSFEDYIGNPAEETFQLVMVNKAGTQIRPVTGLFAGGVSTVPTDHAWFNRTPAP